MLSPIKICYDRPREVPEWMPQEKYKSLADFREKNPKYWRVLDEIKQFCDKQWLKELYNNLTNILTDLINKKSIKEVIKSIPSKILGVFIKNIKDAKNVLKNIREILHKHLKDTNSQKSIDDAYNKAVEKVDKRDSQCRTTRAMDECAQAARKKKQKNGHGFIGAAVNGGIRYIQDFFWIKAPDDTDTSNNDEFSTNGDEWIPAQSTNWTKRPHQEIQASQNRDADWNPLPSTPSAPESMHTHQNNNREINQKRTKTTETIILQDNKKNEKLEQTTALGESTYELYEQYYQYCQESWQEPISREEWDIRRLETVKYISSSDLKVFSDYLSSRRHLNSDIDEESYNAFLSAYWNIVDDEEAKERLKNIFEKFSLVSLEELTRAVILNADLNNPEDIKKIQALSWAYVDEEMAFKIQLNWILDDYTLAFLSMMQEDSVLKETITQILEERWGWKIYDWEALFTSKDAVIKENEEYWKNPEAFWKAQTLDWQREFHWIQNSDAFHSYNDWERQFLREHMRWFNDKITKFLSVPKLQEWEIPDEECKAKREQIWKTIPLDQLRSLYEKFSSNSEEQAKFENYLKENNLPDVTLDNAILRSSIINWNVSINPAANYCYERIWINLYDEIIWESWKALTYLSDKTWDTAFNIKNDVLKYFLKDIVIHPEKEDEWIFYFRDEKNPDTLYWFNPENWKIFQRENISIDSDGAINFLWWEDHLLKQINGFKDIVNLDIEDLIPDTNAEDSDDLKKQILKKIVSKISVENVVDTGDLSQWKVENENKKNVCRDRIVWDIKYLLNIEDSYLQKADGKKYTIFESLIHTFDYIDKEYQGDTVPLSKMKEFLDKVCSSAGQEAVLRPQLLENNFEDKKDSNLPQWLQNWEIKKWEQEMWKFYLLDSLIDPKTQTFDVDLIMELSDDIQITGALAERDFNTVLWTISQRKHLKKLEIDFKKESTSNIEATQLNLNNLKDEIWLSSHIQDIESVA